MFLPPHGTNYFMPYYFRNSICYDNPVIFLPVTDPYHNPGNNARFVFKFVTHKWQSHTLHISCNFKDASQIGDHSHGLVPRSRSTAVFYHP
jgi:hypothetical protein